MPLRRYQGDLLVEEWDAASGLYRRFNSLGHAVWQRPLTADEIAQTQDYDRSVAEAAAVDQAKRHVGGLTADVPAWKQQIAADIAAVQAGGWQALTADEQTQIVVRCLDGFTALIDALVTHATVTGAIPPETEAP